MINFKQYLSEAKSAPLYHGTTGNAFLSILKKRGIEPRTFQTLNKLNLDHNSKISKKYGPYKGAESVNGISFTRNKRFAQSWGKVIMVFDQEKLTRKYKLRTFNYWQGGRPARGPGFVPSEEHKKNYPDSVAHDQGSEYEEFLLMNKNDILSIDYIDHILIKKNNEDIVINAMNETGIYIPYETY